MSNFFLSPVLKQKFTDLNGLPLSGGQLFSYAAGTSTPLATYTDSTGGTPNTNPVILDSTGAANVWVGTLAYKFVLEDSLSNIIYTVDNVVAPGAVTSISLTSQVTGILPIANGGTNAATANAALNNLMPAQGGNAGKFATTDGTNISYAFPLGAAKFNVVSKTSAYSAVINDYIFATNASFIITFPTAVGISGQQIGIQHNGTSLTQVYTLNTTSSQTIGGIASGSYALYTNGETLWLVSDGANWQILNHKTNTPWVSAGNNVISAVTTAPTQVGNTKTVDILWWRRIGGNAEIRIEFKQTAAGTNTTGSGDYLFQIFSGSAIDTTKVTAFGGASVGINAQILSPNSVGSSYSSSTGSSIGVTGGVYVYDSANVRIGGLALGAATGGGFTGMIGSAFSPITNAASVFTASFSVPISGWQP